MVEEVSQRLLEVFSDGHPRIEGTVGILEHVLQNPAVILAAPARIRAELGSRKLNLPGPVGVQPDQGPGQRRLARTRLSHNGCTASGGDIEGDVTQHLAWTVAGGHAANRKHRWPVS